MDDDGPVTQTAEEQQQTVDNSVNPNSPAPPGSTVAVPPSDGEPEGGAGE